MHVANCGFIHSFARSLTFRYSCAHIPQRFHKLLDLTKKRKDKQDCHRQLLTITTTGKQSSANRSPNTKTLHYYAKNQKDKRKSSPASVRHKLQFHSLVISLAYFLTQIPQHSREALNVTRQTRRPPPSQQQHNDGQGPTIGDRDRTASAPWMTRRETGGTGVQNADACGRGEGVIMARCCLCYPRGCLQWR